MDLVNVLDTTPNYLLGVDNKVIAEKEEDFSIYLPKEDIQIINELRKNDDLISLLRKDPKRGIEYVVKKTK